MARKNRRNQGRHVGGHATPTIARRPKPARPSPNPPSALIMPQYCACRGAQGAHLNRSAAGRPISGGPRAARSSPTTARRKHSGMLHAHGGRSGDEAAACAGGARAPRQSRSAPSPRRVGRCTARTNAAAAAAGARWESDCAAGRAWTREGVARKNRRNERLAERRRVTPNVARRRNQRDRRPIPLVHSSCPNIAPAGERRAPT